MNEVGNLPEIDRNWDGHTTEEKWVRIADKFGIDCGQGREKCHIRKS